MGSEEKCPTERTTEGGDDTAWRLLSRWEQKHRPALSLERSWGERSGGERLPRISREKDVGPSQEKAPPLPGDP